MTYKKLYDDMLNECAYDGFDDLPSWITGGKTAAELMEENDPTMYRCGFSDYMDSIAHDKIGCSDCDRTVDPDIVCDASQDDEVLCAVCKGDAFECSTCSDVKPNDQMSTERDVCEDCYEEQQEKEKEEEDESAEQGTGEEVHA